MSLEAVGLLALALAADAMSVGAALGVRYRNARQILRVACCFGLLQALLPMVGATGSDWLLSRVGWIRPWLVFFVLGALGVKMLRGGGNDVDELQSKGDPTVGWRLLTLSIAVSIDALAAGVSLARSTPGLVVSVGIVGAVTAVLTAASMKLAGRLPDQALRWGEVVAGLVLIGLGVAAFWS